MSTEVSDFWQNHSDKFLKMAFMNDKNEIIKTPDGYGKKEGDCGDTIELFIITRGDIIETASYHINGCINTVACTNTLIDMVEGKTLEKAWDVTPEAVAEYLETLPENHFHCAELAVGALYLALANAEALRRDPWKKAYNSHY
ncbi:MAG: iron-sulfur cluster assembly scaffold protein [Proteobacteria bacterium]|nr:iron-sulfur cluster assembly scaffold protein [Pseudomonadota bacterium]